MIESLSAAEVIAIDIPIGLPPTDGSRRADKAAKEFLGPRQFCVFDVPSRSVLKAPNFDAAKRVAHGRKPSIYAFALRKKILDVNDCPTLDQRVREVHPEVSFTAMNGRLPLSSKNSWNGLWERRSLLIREGIEIPVPLPGLAGTDPHVDDVLDAGVAAWTALRITAGNAASLPDPPEQLEGRAVAIWY